MLTVEDSDEKSVRLGYGELAAPGEHSLALWDARGAFLWRVERLAGIVLEDLRKNVFPVYVPPAGWKAGEDVDPDTVARHKDFLMGRWSDVHQEIDSIADPLRAKLHDWAAKYNLLDPWLLIVALGTLRKWSLGVANLSWHLPPPEPFSLPDRAYEFTMDLPGWDAQKMTRREAQEQIRGVFELKLKSFLNGVEKMAEELGMERIKEKRPRHGLDPLRHFDWLVLFQVKGQTLANIADKKGIDEKTVAAGVRQAADQIGLTRRPRRGFSHSPPYS